MAVSSADALPQIARPTSMPARSAWTTSLLGTECPRRREENLRTKADDGPDFRARHSSALGVFLQLRCALGLVDAISPAGFSVPIGRNPLHAVKIVGARNCPHDAGLEVLLA